MRIADTVNDVASSGVQETARATIRASSRVFGYFANQTYSDKYRAILREYVANGIDAHALNGNQDRPVEVILPSPLSPTPSLRFRDFGPGMAHEFMMTSFMAYTDGSTKDSSNDQIGGFGIGSKSGLAYTDQLTFVSRHEGVQRTYSMYQDSDGCPTIGLLHTRDMKEGEETGVDVIIPVKPQDVRTFVEAARTALAYFDPEPVVTNLTDGFIRPTYSARGDGWAMRSAAGNLNVIMGGICYPAADLTRRVPINSDAARLSQYGLDLFMPIGSCGVSLSRESLSFDDKTIETITEALNKITPTLVARINEAFRDIPTKWEAQTRLGEMLASTGGGFSSRHQFLTCHVEWRGEQLFHHSNYMARVGQAWVINAAGSYRGSSLTRPAFGNLGHYVPHNISLVVVDDLMDLPPAKARLTARLVHYVETKKVDRSKGIMVLRGIDPADLGNPTVVKLSDMELPPVQKRERDPNAPKRPKLVAYRANSLSGWGDHRLSNHVRRVVPEPSIPESAIVCSMTNFELSEEDYKRVTSGLFTKDELLFVNSSELPRLVGFPDYRPLVDVFKERLAAKLTEDPRLPTRLYLQSNPAFISFYKKLRGVDLTTTQLRTPAGKIRGLGDYYDVMNVANISLSDFVEARAPRVDVPETLRRIPEEQPEAHWLLTHPYMNYGDNEGFSATLKKVI